MLRSSLVRISSVPSPWAKSSLINQKRKEKRRKDYEMVELGCQQHVVLRKVVHRGISKPFMLVFFAK